jgi:hypothetical protein
VFSDYGRQKMMDNFLTYLNSTGTNPAFHLFTNNRTPAFNDLLANYTELVSGSMPGYSSSVAAAGWIDGRDSPTSNWTAYQPTSYKTVCTATSAGLPQTVYGCYTTDSVAGKLLDAFLFPVPYIFQLPNDTLEVFVSLPLKPGGVGQ